MNEARQSVGGVVVTYHPDSDFEKRLVAMAAEVDDMLVIDNSSDPAVANRLENAKTLLGIRLLLMPGNRGLGVALNAGFADHERRGRNLVVAFDQDSTPETGAVAVLCRFAVARPRAAVVGCNWRDQARPDAPSLHLMRGFGTTPWFNREAATRDLEDVVFVITSGSLFRLKAWRALGGFREDLFVDLVDTEFCLRARASDWDVAVAAGAHLWHRRAQKQAVRWLGRTWWPAHTSPSRLNLVVRNRVWALARYGWTRWPWALFEFTHTGFLLFSALCLEKGATAAKVGAMLRGAWDGLRGRLGAPDWAAVTPTSTSAARTTPS